MLALLACTSLPDPVVATPAALTMEQAVAQLPADPKEPLLRTDADGTMRLVGKVVDVRGAPVSGAQVFVFDGPNTPSMVTDASGSWSLLLPSPPVYLLNINIQADGFARRAEDGAYDALRATSRLVRSVSSQRAALDTALQAPHDAGARVWAIAEMLYAQRPNPLRFAPEKEISPGVHEMSEEEAAFWLTEAVGAMRAAEILGFEYTGVFLPELRAIATQSPSDVLRAEAAALLGRWENKTLQEEKRAPDAKSLARLSCAALLGRDDPNCNPEVFEDKTHTRAIWSLEVHYGDGGSVYQVAARREGDTWVLTQMAERMHWSGG